MNTHPSGYEKSTFYHIRKILNSYKLHKTFTRKEIRKKINDLNVNVFTGDFDNHRKFLMKMGYLETISKGKYKLLKLIPDEGIKELIKRNYTHNRHKLNKSQ